MLNKRVNLRKIVVTNTETKEELSFSEFKKQSKKDLVLYSEVVKKLLTEEELEKLINMGKLFTVTIGNKKYVNKVFLQEVLRTANKWEHKDTDSPTLFGFLD